MTGSKASAAHALVVAFSARLDSLVSAWEVAIAEQRSASPVARSGGRRNSVDVLAELERDLRDLELHSHEHRRVADAEARAAADWEHKAMMSIREGRDGLARQALLRLQQHVAGAGLAANEAAAIETMRDAFRNAVLAVRATLPSDATLQ